VEKETIESVREAVDRRQTHMVVIKVVVHVAGISAQRLVGFAFESRSGCVQITFGLQA